MDFCKDLGKPALIETLRTSFREIEDPEQGGRIPLDDHLMAAFAMFFLKEPGLLNFNEASRNRTLCDNLWTLFGIDDVPVDSEMRKRLDTLDPAVLRPAFRQLFDRVQRGGILEKYAVLDGHYLLSIARANTFSSRFILCSHCDVTNHRDDESQTFSHSLLAGMICHPARKEAFPLVAEPITKDFDDLSRSDSERRASARLIAGFRKHYPHLKTVIVQDGQVSNGSHIADLKARDLRFILSAGAGDLRQLRARLDDSASTRSVRHVDNDGTVHDFRYLNDTPINTAHAGILVNVVEYREPVTTSTRVARHRRKPVDSTHNIQVKQKRFTWVTDLPVTDHNLMEIMDAGRSRWHIEKETLNTMKIEEYCFDHNDGHGHEHLTTVLSMLMLIAFLTDQIEAASCSLYAAALKRHERRMYLRGHTRTKVSILPIRDWKTLYDVLIHGQEKAGIVIAKTGERSGKVLGMPPGRGIVRLQSKWPRLS